MSAGATAALTATRKDGIPEDADQVYTYAQPTSSRVARWGVRRRLP